MDRTKYAWWSHSCEKEMKKTLAQALEDACPEFPDYGKLAKLEEIVKVLIMANEPSRASPLRREYEMTIAIGSSMEYQLLGRKKDVV